MNPVNGFQKERIALSWLRTQIILFGISIVMFRFALAHTSPTTYVTSILAMLVACACTLSRSNPIKFNVSTIIFLLALVYVWTTRSKVIS